MTYRNDIHIKYRSNTSTTISRIGICYSFFNNNDLLLTNNKEL